MPSINSVQWPASYWLHSCNTNQQSCATVLQAKGANSVCMWSWKWFWAVIWTKPDYYQW